MTAQRSLFRYEIRSARHLDELSSLPLAMREGRQRRSQHRDLFLDTPDDALRRRNIVCRLRLRSDDTRTLSVAIGTTGEAIEERYESRVESADVIVALGESGEALRRLRAMTDPSLLVVKLEIETERFTRTAGTDWLWRPRIEIHYDRMVVRRAPVSGKMFQFCIHNLHGDITDASALAHAMEEAHHLRLSTQGARDRGEHLLRWKGFSSNTLDTSQTAEFSYLQAVDVAAGEFLNPELSLLAFQSRVLALAEDTATPLAERLRFLGIVNSNLDEFFMIRMAGLRQKANEQQEEQCDDGLTHGQQLRLIRERVEEITKRQSVCLANCLRELAPHGVRVLSWVELNEAEKSALRNECREQIHPSLTPMAMTLSPGHPLPHLPHLTLALAVVLRSTESQRLHLAEVELPSDSPRFLEVAGQNGAFVPLEEAIRSNIDLIYPGGGVEGVYVFRVTRGGELLLDEAGTEDLLDAVDNATKKRGFNPAVRIEVEHAMPEFVRDLLLTNLRKEDPDGAIRLGPSDIHEVAGLLDLRRVGELEVPRIESLSYPQFSPRKPDIEGSMLDEVARGDIMVHHPFDSFDATVVRFLRDAADDPDVTAIKMTLYRIGSSSGIADALIQAARNGKKVVAFVELKARFDEGRNVGWARKLEKAGGHVVSGLVGYKNHAKVVLVIRRENGRLRSYAHVGTGNYNSRSGAEYTDVSLFSSRHDLTADVADLFNGLTGGSMPPTGLSRGALIAPFQMKDAIISLIEREGAHARAGKPARLTFKMNGLSDTSVIRALLAASRDGVQVQLICRGICTLRPEVEGISDRVKVTSVVGRFLEHSRIYRFGNGGNPEYFIGSADLRPRNLSRRVELLAPVREPVHHAMLDGLLELYLNDSTAWELNSDGGYVQRDASGAPSAQDALVSTHFAEWRRRALS
ncbi:MAG: polyphosphate kinase 1 [Gemmatimonadaceae bacterium]